MKKTALILLMMLLLDFNLFANQYKTYPKKNRPSTERANSDSEDEITKEDMIHALEILGVNFFKYDIGAFDTVHGLQFIIDEYEAQKIIKSDTIEYGDNTYHYFAENDTTCYFDYLEKIKITTKENGESVKFFIDLKDREIPYEIRLKSANTDQFYIPKKYSNCTWKLNKKIPILSVVSSWWDSEINQYRCCGPSMLKENDTQSTEFLKESPHYFVVSYLIYD